MTEENDIAWGVAMSAPQTEGAWNVDGRGSSIWDDFTQSKRKFSSRGTILDTANFYNHYKHDIHLLANQGIKHFRTSFSWSRILPNGKGKVNHKGLDFYKRLINTCLENNVEPWMTAYHWDLPSALEEKGGWRNRDIIHWFESYLEVLTTHFGDTVKNWMVLNEPLAFTGAGYFLGIHAPGKKGMSHFLPTVLHASLAQSTGINFIQSRCPEANVGTTFSMSPLDAYRLGARDRKAAQRVDAVLNRLFMEPLLGYGFPTDVMPVFNRLEHYMEDGDESLLMAKPNFIGIQNYTREVVKHAWYIPYVKAAMVSAKKRGKEFSAMGWEVYHKSLSKCIKRVHDLSPNINLVITENGLATEASKKEVELDDKQRIAFIKHHVEVVKNLKQEGLPIDGYFVWSWLDNFEWAEGFRPRFGLVHVDYETEKRQLKKSGEWYGNWCKNNSTSKVIV